MMATDNLLWDQLNRERQVILAMQQRVARNPIREFFWRRPWRSSFGWRQSLQTGDTLPIRLRNLWRWFAAAHDCKDPAVGCSCYPSFRHPPVHGPGDL